ncbi:hypothetical protein DSO57_1015672 [Entomophthora muscae]|uniref:Uncharacterized protein n=1 Tax=Entomophthora muscae TaxID=34485 RepID=A0ACC2US89_9FUNG|nr:hypothetical protein DSO57_1015672 [Entomophthora muscae]
MITRMILKGTISDQPDQEIIILTQSLFIPKILTKLLLGSSRNLMIQTRLRNRITVRYLFWKNMKKDFAPLNLKDNLFALLGSQVQNAEPDDSILKIRSSLSALSCSRSTGEAEESVFLDNSKLIDESLKSLSEKEPDSSEEVESETSDVIGSEHSEEPLFESTKELITAEANRLIHLNLENPYFLLRFFKLAQKVRSDYQRQKLLIAMETMTSSEYSQFLKTKSHKQETKSEDEESSSDS